MRLALAIVVALTLAACGRPDAVAEEEQDAAELPDPVNRSSPSPTGARPSNAVSTGSGTVSKSRVPAALQGRWGLSPGDCMTSHGSEGLLTISANEVRFHESVAVPSADVQTSANSISGNFAFAGEGENWTRHQTFELRGSTLVRTDRDPVATFRYVRC